MTSMRRYRAFPLLSLILVAGAGSLPVAGQTPDPSAGPVPSMASSQPDVPSSPATQGSPLPVATPILDPAGSVSWVRLAAEGPPAREDHTLTVDPDGSSALLLGGRDGDKVFADLWRLDLATDAWARVDPPGDRPARRFGHTATWMPGLGLVVFGGQADSTFYDDLWAFDPGTGRWTELPAGGRRPEARYGTCAALGADGRLWISHGFTSSGRFGDTRAWDPATGAWAKETPASGDAPAVRCLHDCLWAPDGRLLLYGGQTFGVASLGDLWALDPVAGAWTALPDPTPGARRLYAITTDTPGSAWLFGGADDRDRPLADLWRWDLVTLDWTRIEPTDGAPRPTARFGATLVTDPARGRLLLFGGEGRDGRSAELWELAPAP